MIRLWVKPLVGGPGHGETAAVRYVPCDGGWRPARRHMYVERTPPDDIDDPAQGAHTVFTYHPYDYDEAQDAYIFAGKRDMGGGS